VNQLTELTFVTGVIKRERVAAFETMLRRLETKMWFSNELKLKIYSFQHRERFYNVIVLSDVFGTF
jgi:hypothetical protein